MDHLDGVLILDRAPRDQRARRCAPCASATTPRALAAVARTVYLGTSDVRGRRPAAAGRRRAHRPQLVVTRPDRPAGRGRRLTPPPVATLAARARASTLDPARGRQRAGRVRADRRRRARRRHRLRLRRADQRAAALRARDPQRPPVAAAALARRGADRAGDHGRRRRDRASRSCGSPPGSTRARLPAAGRADPARRRLRLARGAASRSSARCCSCAPSTSARRSPSRTRRASPTPRRSTAEDRTLDPPRRPRERERVVRALTPHIGARIALGDGTFLGVLRAHAEGDALVLDEVQPPGGRPMAFADWARGRPEQAAALGLGGAAG